MLRYCCCQCGHCHCFCWLYFHIIDFIGNTVIPIVVGAAIGPEGDAQLTQRGLDQGERNGCAATAAVVVIVLVILVFSILVILAIISWCCRQLLIVAHGFYYCQF